MLVVQLSPFSFLSFFSFYRKAAAPVNCGQPWTDDLWDWTDLDSWSGPGCRLMRLHLQPVMDTDQPQINTQVNISTGETTLDFQEQVTSLCLHLLQLENHLFSTTSEQRLRFQHVACFLVESRPQPCICNRIAPTLSPHSSLCWWIQLGSWTIHASPPEGPAAALLTHRSCWPTACIWCHIIHKRNKWIPQFSARTMTFRKMKKSCKIQTKFFPLVCTNLSCRMTDLDAVLCKLVYAVLKIDLIQKQSTNTSFALLPQADNPKHSEHYVHSE